MSYFGLVVSILLFILWYKCIYFSVFFWDKYYNIGVCGLVVVILWKLYYSEEIRVVYIFFLV